MWTFHKVGQEVCEEVLWCCLSWWVRIWSTWCSEDCPYYTPQQPVWVWMLNALFCSVTSSWKAFGWAPKCTVSLRRVLECAPVVACSFPKMDLFSPLSCMWSQSSPRCHHRSLFSHSWELRAGSGVPSRYFWSGHRCIFAHQPTDVRLKAADLRHRAGIEPALEWQLDPVGCHIWACWRRECWDVALSCSKTLALLSPGCLGRSHCGNLE